MGYDHNRIKSNARLFYKNNTGNSIISQLIYYGVTFGAVIAVYLIMGILAFFLGMGIAIFELGDVSDGFESAVESSPFIMVLSLLIMVVIYAFMFFTMYPLQVGIMGWYRESIYRQVPLKEIFFAYKKDRILGNVGTMFLVQLFVGLWSMLFIVPGIIKSYSYSQAVFIKAQNPNISAMRAIELSKVMMEGHKGELFYLHLSFLGWMLLSGLTYNILGIVYVFPYFYSALAFAYEEIKADAAARGIVRLEEFEPNVY